MTAAETFSQIQPWSRVVGARSRVHKPVFRDQLSTILANRGGKALAIGLCRSYGDTILNPEGKVLDLTALDRLIEFDRENGTLCAEAGASLSELLRVIVPAGWFFSTVPGTRFVTLGGAVANDVHGKNHHFAGSFGNSVDKIELIRTDDCSPRLVRDGDKLYSATIGGLGLTGIISTVGVKLARIGSSYLEVERIPFRQVQDFFQIAQESAGSYEHTIAWIDTTSRGRNLARGIFQRARWLGDGDYRTHDLQPRLRIMIDTPSFLLNRCSLSLFNTLYYMSQRGGPKIRRVHYTKFLFPLDSVGEWNRLYGRAGFFQYQCVFPPDSSEVAVSELLSEVSKKSAASFLSVLKTFGSRRPRGLLSFPMEGATLALDFPNRGRETLDLLARLDRIVEQYRGRLYPAKDARMSAKMFRSSYPDWEKFLPYIDNGLNSSFWSRVATQ